MNKQKTILTWFVLSTVVITELLKYNYYTYVFSNRFYISGAYDVINLFGGIFALFMNVFLMILAIKGLNGADSRASDKAYALLRYVFVMNTIMSIPVILFRLPVFTFKFDLLYSLTFLLRIAAEITLSVFLLKYNPEVQVQRVNIQDYDMVTFTSGGHRFTHYLLDRLFLLPFWIYMFQSLSLSNRFGGYGGGAALELMLQLMIISSYLAYCFFSESIFRQTLGKIVTGSVVVSNGVELSGGRIFLRTLSRLIPFDALSFLFGSKWHDRVSHTSVVYADSWEKAFDFEQKQDAAQ